MQLRITSMMPSLWNWLAIFPLTMMVMGVDIGVNYGMQGDNLPPPAEVIGLYKQYNIKRLRLFDPNPSALEALRGSNLTVTIGVLNQDIPNLASSVDAANSWFSTNVEPYLNDVTIEYIAVGNEAIPGPFASSIAPAMQNLYSVLQSHNLPGILVSTSVAGYVIQNSYPPSASEFTPKSRDAMVSILNFLSTTGPAVLLVNLYPYRAYASNPAHVSLEYAQFTAAQAVVQDGNLSYTNLLDAMVDGFYWAMEKVNAPKVIVVLSESGWPSAGNGDFTTPELASTYNKNFVQHILSRSGTPKRPGWLIRGYIFAMFNENQKPAGIEQNWGLFYPDKKPVYSLF